MLTIRDFTEADRKDYLSMCAAFYTSTAVLHNVPAEHFTRTFDACLQGNPYLRGFAFVQDGAFAGHGLLSLTWSGEAGGLCVLLEEASVAPEFRGHGIGSAFLRFVEETYRGRAKRLRLEVTHSNIDAMRLYKRFGYEEYDYVQMVKELS